MQTRECWENSKVYANLIEHKLLDICFCFCFVLFFFVFFRRKTFSLLRQRQDNYSTNTLQYTTYITLLSLLLSFTKFLFSLILYNIKLKNKTFNIELNLDEK